MYRATPATAMTVSGPRVASSGRARSSGGSPNSETTAQTASTVNSPPRSRAWWRRMASARSLVRSSEERAANTAASSRPTGVAMANPALRPVSTHLRRGQGVQQQEPGAGQEHQRDQEQAGVGPAAGHLAHAHPERHVDRGHGHHQPEVDAVVLQDDVEVGLGQEQPQPGQRQDQMEGPDGDAQGRPSGYRRGHVSRPVRGGPVPPPRGRPGRAGRRRPRRSGRG